MYTEHLGLSRRPFTQEPGEDLYVANPTVSAAAARLAHGLTARDSVVVISGGPGVGKTSLVEHALASVADRTVVARVDMRCAEAEELYELLLNGLGEESGKVPATVAVSRLRETMARQRSQGRHVVLSLDLPGLNVELARRLLRLVNLAGEQGCQLNLVLQGPHNLHQTLDVPGLINLRQRVTFRYRVRPLTLVETGAYVRHALEKAGRDMDSFMAPNTAASIYLYVAGVPRLINTLTDAVLSEACVQQVPRVDAELIRNVADQLGWKPLAGKPAAGQPVPAAATAARVARKPTAAPAPTRSQPAAPAIAASDMTSRLLAAKISEPELQSLASDDAPPRLAARREQPALPSRPASAIPPMDPVDPGATGMLKLEDLDPRFAESLFAEDSEK